MVAGMMNSMNNQLLELRVGYKDKSYKLSVRLRPTSNGLIVFLHGWGCTKESFADSFSSNALKGYGICAIDLVGFGESEKPEDFSYDLLDQANVVALAINSLKAKRVYIVGHSMGGGIGLLAAPLLKEKLVKFISAEGNLAPRGSGVDARIVSKQPFWLFQSLTLPVLKLIAQLYPNRGIRAWAQWSRKASPLGLYRSVQSLVSWSDSGKLLALFTSLPQKAYIYSENGNRRKDVVPELSKSITYEIPDSNHGLMVDNPSGFYTTVAKIIRGT